MSQTNVAISYETLEQYDVPIFHGGQYNFCPLFKASVYTVKNSNYTKINIGDSYKAL